MKQTFVSWCQKSDINGLSKIFDYENNFVKFIWLIILLVSLGVNAWIMSWSIVAYLQYEVVSLIQVFSERPTEFPAVTICDINQFTTEKGLSFVNSLIDAKCDEKCAAFNAAMNASNPEFSAEYKKLFGLNLAQISCYFHGDRNNCLNYFHWIWNYDYGNCFQFNSILNNLDTKTISVEGILNSLSIKKSKFTNVNLTKIGTLNLSG